MEPTLWVAAFLAGLLGSGHCFGMCGGIAGSLGAISGASTRSIAPPALQFNFGRVLGYALLGAVAGGVLGAAGVDRDRVFPWMRPWFPQYQLADGGLNCDERVYTRETPRSSFLSTLPPLEAVSDGETPSPILTRQWYDVVEDLAHLGETGLLRSG